MVLATLAINGLLIAPVILYMYMIYSHIYWQKSSFELGTWFFGNVKDVVLFRRHASHLIGDLFLNAKPEDDVYGVYTGGRRTCINVLSKHPIHVHVFPPVVFEVHRRAILGDTTDYFRSVSWDSFENELKSDIRDNNFSMMLGELHTEMGLITVIKDFEVSLDPSYKYGIDPHNVFFTVPRDFILNSTKL